MQILISSEVVSPHVDPSFPLLLCWLFHHFMEFCMHLGNPGGIFMRRGIHDIGNKGKVHATMLNSRILKGSIQGMQAYLKGRGIVFIPMALSFPFNFSQ